MALKVEGRVIPLELSPGLGLLGSLVFSGVAVLVVTAAVVRTVRIFVIVVDLLVLLLIDLLHINDNMILKYTLN